MPRAVPSELECHWQLLTSSHRFPTALPTTHFTGLLNQERDEETNKGNAWVVRVEVGSEVYEVERATAKALVWWSIYSLGRLGL